MRTDLEDPYQFYWRSPSLHWAASSYIYYLSLASVDLSGLVGEADSPPICLHSPLAQLALDLRFLFYKVRIPTPCIFAPPGF